VISRIRENVDGFLSIHELSYGLAVVINVRAGMTRNPCFTDCQSTRQILC
jgi:hypothetical protein